MLGRSLRLLSFSVLALTVSAVGCADLIGLGSLDASGGSGGASANDLEGSGGSSDSSGGTVSGGAPSGGADGAGGDVASGGSAGNGGAGPDCTSDEFESASLTAACWRTFNGGRLFGAPFVDEEAGTLVLRPDGGTAWFDGDSAFLLYQEISGDFLIEVELSVFAGSTSMSSEDPPYLKYANGGIVAFPASQALEAVEDTFSGYYAIKAGTLDDPGYAGFKGEFTFDDDVDMTSMAQVPAAAGWSGAGLRMCRLGDVLWTGFQTMDDPTGWHELHAAGHPSGYDTADLDLPDLADAMYVGLPGELWDPLAEDGEARIVYTRAEFSVPRTLDDCQK